MQSHCLALRNRICLPKLLAICGVCCGLFLPQGSWAAHVSALSQSRENLNRIAHEMARSQNRAEEILLDRMGKVISWSETQGLTPNSIYFGTTISAAALLGVDAGMVFSVTPVDSEYVSIEVKEALGIQGEVGTQVLLEGFVGVSFGPHPPTSKNKSGEQWQQFLQFGSDVAALGGFSTSFSTPASNASPAFFMDLMSLLSHPERGLRRLQTDFEKALKNPGTLSVEFSLDAGEGADINVGTTWYHTVWQTRCKYSDMDDEVRVAQSHFIDSLVQDAKEFLLHH